MNDQHFIDFDMLLVLNARAHCTWLNNINITGKRGLFFGKISSLFVFRSNWKIFVHCTYGINIFVAFTELLLISNKIIC